MFCKKIPEVSQKQNCCRCVDNKWITPEQGLPDTNREVIVIYDSYDIYSQYTTNIKKCIGKSRFNSCKGWDIHHYINAWKEIDCETKRLLTI